MMIPSPTQTPFGTNPLRAAVAPVLTLLLVAGVYANTLGNGFVFDDQFVVLSNEHIRSLANVPEMVTSEFWAGSDRTTQNYRPLQLVTVAVDHALFGMAPWGYHLSNVLWHLLAVGMAFWLARHLTGSAAIASMAAVCFGVHPLQSEAVNSIAWRGDVMAAGLTLAALSAYAYWSSGDRDAPTAKRRAALGFSWVACGLACLSKETGITVVVLVILYEWLVRGRGSIGSLLRSLRTRWMGVTGFATLAVAYLGLRTLVLGRVLHSQITFLENPLAFEPVLRQKVLALSLIFRYARLVVWPAKLSVDYSYDSLPLDLDWYSPAVLVGLGVLAASAGLIWVLRRAESGIAFGLAFMLVTYMLTANLLFPIQTMMAERFMTLPMFGCALTAAIVWWRSLGFGKTRAIAWCLAVVVVGALAWRTVTRNRDWRDSMTLFSAAAAVAPRSAKVQYGLGYLLEEQSRYDEAAVAYGEAISIWPQYSAAWSDRSLVLSALGRDDEAESAAEQAVELTPGDPLAWNNLGVVRYRADRLEEAAEAWRRACALDPQLVAARTNLTQVEQELAGEGRTP